MSQRRISADREKRRVKNKAKREERMRFRMDAAKNAINELMRKGIQFQQEAAEETNIKPEIKRLPIGDLVDHSCKHCLGRGWLRMMQGDMLQPELCKCVRKSMDKINGQDGSVLVKLDRASDELMLEDIFGLEGTS